MTVGSVRRFPPAAFYDATRALPYGVAEEVRGALVRHLRADRDTRFPGQRGREPGRNVRRRKVDSTSNLKWKEA